MVFIYCFQIIFFVFATHTLYIEDINVENTKKETTEKPIQAPAPTIGIFIKDHIKLATPSGVKTSIKVVPNPLRIKK